MELSPEAEKCKECLSLKIKHCNFWYWVMKFSHSCHQNDALARAGIILTQCKSY